MPTIDLGKIKPQYEAAYSGAVAYEPLDFVNVAGSLFVCKLATTGNAPPAPGTNNTWWDSVAPAPTYSGDIHSAPAKLNPVDADEIGIADSEAAFSLSKVTWGTLRSFLGGTAWSVKTTNYALNYGDRIQANTTGGVIILTLPAAPVAGKGSIIVADYLGTFATNKVTIARNGSKIMGLSEDMDMTDNNLELEFNYIDSTVGWKAS